MTTFYTYPEPTPGKAFGKTIPLAVLFTRTSAAIRPRTLQSIVAEFQQAEIHILTTQIHERDAYRAIFSFGGTLSGLDAAQVTNITAAVANARAFAAEVVGMLKGKIPASKVVGAA